MSVVSCTPFDHVPDDTDTTSPTPTVSRFELLAAYSSQISATHREMLDVLLHASRVQSMGGPECFAPLWAEEAMHRALNLMRLLGMRDRCARPPASGAPAVALAHALASLYQQLDLGPDRSLVPCGALLSGVASSLGTLFGTTTSQVRVTTHVDDMLLPPYRRRALVLLGGTLIMNALRHAFRGRCRGEIVVRLSMAPGGQANLLVVDDGTGVPPGRTIGPHSVVHSLVDVLDGTVCCRVRGLRGTAMAVDFPAWPDIEIAAA
jgi:two-component sensor histidine kinase